MVKVKAKNTKPGEFYKIDPIYGDYFSRDPKGRVYNRGNNIKFYRLDLLEDPPEFQMHSLASEYEILEIDFEDMKFIISSIFEE